MSNIRFNAKLYNIGSWTILKLPKDASTKLPSRGMTMVDGTINGFRIKVPLEPDGKGSHWFKVNKSMLSGAKADVGDTVKTEMEPSDVWSKPELPADLKKALRSAPDAQTLWTNITPNAQWDWIRWIRATKNPETRARRIEVAISKLNAGTRRPCCFNRNVCTEPEVSHNYVLLESTKT